MLRGPMSDTPLLDGVVTNFTAGDWACSPVGSTVTIPYLNGLASEMREQRDGDLKPFGVHTTEFGSEN